METRRFNSSGMLKWGLALTLTVFALTLFLYPRLIREESKCVQIRTGFDVGSGSTKVLVAEVNVCKKKILRVIFEATEKVEFQEALNKSPTNEIVSAPVDKAIQVILNMKRRAAELGSVHASGYATAAFRQARNGEAAVAEISRATDVPLRVIDQDEEGLLGVKGVVGSVDTPMDRLVVWDIGGGSLEITTPTNGSLSVYKGVVASVGFKDLVIEQVKRLDPKKTKSPNPLSKTEVEEAVRRSKALAKNVPAATREFILRPNTVVIGIGGVHWHSVRNQLGGVTEYTAEQVREKLEQRVGLTDEALKSDYAETEVTNLALILGFMNELQIRSVRPLKISLGHAAILE